MEENKINEELFFNLESYLYYKKHKVKFIKRGLKYTTNDINKLKLLASKYSRMYINDIFELAADNDQLFISESQCCRCNNIYIYKLSKEKFVNLLYENTKCNKCTEEEQEENKKLYLINKIKLEEEKINNIKLNTPIFIDIYCNPLADYKKSKTPYQGLDIMYKLYKESDIQYLISYIKKLKYKDFLNTNYWKKIKEYKKYRSNYSCELCSTQNNLHVHHKTYKNHGYEIHKEIIYNDLVVLCEDCHHKFHDNLHKEE